LLPPRPVRTLGHSLTDVLCISPRCRPREPILKFSRKCVLAVRPNAYSLEIIDGAAPLLLLQRGLATADPQLPEEPKWRRTTARFYVDATLSLSNLLGAQNR